MNEMTPPSNAPSLAGLPEAKHAPTEDDLLAASLLGHRDDYVIDLRVDGEVESYLRGHQSVPNAGSGPLRVTRRALDVATATAALVVTSPIMISIAVVSKLSSRGPIFFAQERVGRGGRVFRCLKFRSMHINADDRLKELLETDEQFRTQWLESHKADRDPRVTLLGRFLRKTSLDELPQLVNVLRGDMSMVGPRPVVPEETVRYAEAITEVLSIRPGVTGLWQVSGRNNLSYTERIALDLEYVEKQGLLLDAKILIRTLKTVVTGHGAS